MLLLRGLLSSVRFPPHEGMWQCPIVRNRMSCFSWAPRKNTDSFYCTWTASIGSPCDHWKCRLVSLPGYDDHLLSLRPSRCWLGPIYITTVFATYLDDGVYRACHSLCSRRPINLLENDLSRTSRKIAVSNLTALPFVALDIHSLTSDLISRTSARRQYDVQPVGRMT